MEDKLKLLSNLNKSSDLQLSKCVFENTIENELEIQKYIKEKNLVSNKKSIASSKVLIKELPNNPYCSSITGKYAFDLSQISNFNVYFWTSTDDPNLNPAIKRLLTILNVSAVDWELNQKTQCKKALDIFTTFTGTTSTVINNYTECDVVCVIAPSEAVGVCYGPVYIKKNPIFVDNKIVYFISSQYLINNIDEGTLIYNVMIREWGRGFGLAHPYYNDAESTIMPGVVENEPRDYQGIGGYIQNNNFNTVMSSNYQFFINKRKEYQYPETIMPLDALALRWLYNIGEVPASYINTYGVQLIDSTLLGEYHSRMIVGKNQTITFGPKCNTIEFYLSNQYFTFNNLNYLRFEYIRNIETASAFYTKDIDATVSVLNLDNKRSSYIFIENRALKTNLTINLNNTYETSELLLYIMDSYLKYSISGKSIIVIRHKASGKKITINRNNFDTYIFFNDNFFSYDAEEDKKLNKNPSNLNIGDIINKKLNENPSNLNIGDIINKKLNENPSNLSIEDIINKKLNQFPSNLNIQDNINKKLNQNISNLSILDIINKKLNKNWSNLNIQDIVNKKEINKIKSITPDKIKLVEDREPPQIPLNQYCVSIMSKDYLDLSKIKNFNIYYWKSTDNYVNIIINLFVGIYGVVNWELYQKTQSKKAFDVFTTFTGTTSTIIDNYSESDVVCVLIPFRISEPYIYVAPLGELSTNPTIYDSKIILFMGSRDIISEDFKEGALVYCKMIQQFGKAFGLTPPDFPNTNTDVFPRFPTPDDLVDTDYSIIRMPAVSPFKPLYQSYIYFGGYIQNTISNTIMSGINSIFFLQEYSEYNTDKIGYPQSLMPLDALALRWFYDIVDIPEEYINTYGVNIINPSSDKLGQMAMIVGENQTITFGSNNKSINFYLTNQWFEYYNLQPIKYEYNRPIEKPYGFYPRDLDSTISTINLDNTEESFIFLENRALRTDLTVNILNNSGQKLKFYCMDCKQNYSIRGNVYRNLDTNITFTINNPVGATVNVYFDK